MQGISGVADGLWVSLLRGFWFVYWVGWFFGFGLVTLLFIVQRKADDMGRTCGPKPRGE